MIKVKEYFHLHAGLYNFIQCLFFIDLAESVRLPTRRAIKGPKEALTFHGLYGGKDHFCGCRIYGP